MRVGWTEEGGADDSSRSNEVDDIADDLSRCQTLAPALCEVCQVEDMEEEDGRRRGICEGR